MQYRLLAVFLCMGCLGINPASIVIPYVYIFLMSKSCITISSTNTAASQIMETNTLLPKLTVYRVSRFLSATLNWDHSGRLIFRQIRQTSENNQRISESQVSGTSVSYDFRIMLAWHRIQRIILRFLIYSMSIRLNSDPVKGRINMQQNVNDSVRTVRHVKFGRILVFFQIPNDNAFFYIQQILVMDKCPYSWRPSNRRRK